MWSYYGSKSKIVHLYPPPKYGKIIEPFAGSARYSLKYFDRDVTLYDKYKVIVDLWKYLQQASCNDIMNLPDIEQGKTVDDYNLSNEEKYLIGFCINGGSAQPKKSPKAFSTWDVRKRKDIASQLDKIRHWNVILGDYNDVQNDCATWFVDPPYKFGGEWYVCGNQKIDYDKLSEWCMSRAGQIIVCENTKASWLPFVPLKQMRGSKYTTTEAYWTNDNMVMQPNLL